MLIEEKQNLRARMKRERRAAGKALRRQWSAMIRDLLIADPLFQEVDCVMAFVSMATEVETRPILEEVLTSGRELVLPRCYADGSGFDPVTIGNLKTHLVAGPMRGLMDPSPTLPVRPRGLKIPLVLVPGLAFDSRRYRLGYGKGMYDRFLADYKPEHTIGLGFALQMVGLVPIDPHDVPLNRLLTQNGWL